MSTPDFRNRFCILVCATYFQFATHACLFTMLFTTKRRLIHLIYVHYRLPKQVSTTVCKLFSQIGVEFILNWLPNDRNPYQGRTKHVNKKKVILAYLTIILGKTNLYKFLKNPLIVFHSIHLQNSFLE